jgi:lipid-binding SYLF domain-containing protein
MKPLAFILAQAPDVRPDFNVIPGSNTFESLVNGAMGLAIILAVAGIVIGGGLWGVGSLSANHHAATIGKRVTLYSIVGAMIVGAARMLVDWAFGLGQAAS